VLVSAFQPKHEVCALKYYSISVMHIPPAPLIPQGELMDVTPTLELMAGMMEEQIGGGPSPYHLCPSINLTLNALKEAHFAAQNCQTAYPMEESTPLPDGLDDLGEEVLMSMCTDSNIELTPTSPHHAILQPACRPPQSNHVSLSMDPFLVPVAQPHKKKAKEQLLHMLGLGPPPQTNSPSPSSPSPQLHNPPPKATRGFSDSPSNIDDGLSNVDNIADDNENQSSPCGWISNLHHELLHGTYEQVDEIFCRAAKEMNQPLKGIIANYTQKHGQSSRKSDWNVYQQFFASDPDRERDYVGDPHASGGWLSWFLLTT
jgi:hypothetical protein